MRDIIDISYKKDADDTSYTHYHNENEIILVTHGSSEFIINSKKYVLRKNSMIIIGNLEKHSMKILTKKYERYVVKLSPSYNPSPMPANIFSKIFQKRPYNFPYIFSFNDSELSEIKRILDKLITKNTNLLLDDCYTNILLSELFIIIVRNNEDYFSSKQSELEEEIIKIQEYINENYNKHVSLADLEKKFYISKFTISREFKLITGYNFKQYIILLRISKAKDLLVYSNKNINEISNEVGYDTDNVFIRMFKKYEMMTPTEFRKEFKHINNN